MTCSINNTECSNDDEEEKSICGTDDTGFLYHQKHNEVVCNSAGHWEDACDGSLMEENLCSAQVGKCDGDIFMMGKLSVDGATETVELIDQQTAFNTYCRGGPVQDETKFFLEGNNKLIVPI